MGTTTAAPGSTATDDELLELAHSGDDGALRALLDRHLHPAWRIALVAAPDAGAAEAAVVEGFCDGLQAAHRHPDPTIPLRVRIVAATRRAAALAAPTGAAPIGDSSDAVIRAFAALPEKSRTAVWLTEVEGGKPEQVGPVLGLDRTATNSLATRASASLRQRLASDVAASAESEACRRALAKLPAHAAGKLTPAEREAVSAHVTSCGTCAVWLASLVSPRPALRGLIVATPVDLAAAVAARWTELLERQRRGWLAPFSERAIGAAAAAVLAIGLGGIALLARDRGGRSDLATPAAADAAGAATGESAIGPLDPGSTASSTSSAASHTTTTPTEVKSAVSAPTTSTDAPAPTTTTTLPPVPPPADEPELPDTTPPETTEIAVDVLGGTVTLGVGDCTGATVLDQRLGCTTESTSEAPLTVSVTVPGLPPIGL